MGFYGNATYYLPNGIAQDVVDGVITTKKLATDAVTASKIADTAIHGKGNASEWQHIAKESISGGKDGDIAPNTITDYNIHTDAIKEQHIENGQIHGSGDSSNYQHIAPGSVGKEDLADQSVWKQKIAATVITGLGAASGNLVNPIKEDGRPSHFASRTIAGEKHNHDNGNTHLPGDIALDTITGGSAAGEGNIAKKTINAYNMADNSIGTDQIINAAITKDKLDKIYWSSSKKSEHIIGNFAQLLEALPYDFANDGQPSLSLIYINNISQENWTNVEPIFPKGWYISLRNYGAINLIGYRGNQGANYELKLTKDENGNTILGSQIHHKIVGGENGNIATDTITGGENGNIATDTITGGDKLGMGNIAPNTIYGYNIHDGAISSRHIADNSIKGSAVVGVDYGQIVPGSIGTYDIANNAITEDKLANTFLKIAYYYDEEAPTTLEEICKLLKDFTKKNMIVSFRLLNSTNPNDVTMNGLTPGYYWAYPALMNNSNEAPGLWYLHNLSTNEHWQIETYTQYLNKIYLNDYIDTNLKEYDSVIELKNDLDQQPMKTCIIGMQRAVSNLPSGRYIALPTHEHIGSMKPNRILIHLTTGVSYTLRTTSVNTVIVSTYTGHPNTNSEWLTFNQFNETEEIIINEKSYGSGKIMLYNQYQYKDLPIHIWNWTYLVAQLNLSTFDDESKSFTTKCIIAGKLPAIGSIKNTTGKQLQFSTGQTIANGASLNLPNPKDLEGNEIVDNDLIKDYGYKIYMELIDFDSDTILCNIQYFQGLNSDLFPGAIVV